MRFSGFSSRSREKRQAGRLLDSVIKETTMTVSNSSEEGKWYRVECAPPFSYLKATRRDSDGRYVLRFTDDPFIAGGTVTLSPAELVSQPKALAKMAAAGIAMLLPDRPWNSHDWYNRIARPVIWACEDKERSEGGGE
jgi:hypothetical protein